MREVTFSATIPTTVIGKVTVDDNCSDAEIIELIKKSCSYDNIIEENSSYEFENVEIENIVEE